MAWHVEEARVNVSSFTHFFERLFFIVIVIEKVIIRPFHAKLWENHMIWNSMPGKCSFQTCWLQNPEYNGWLHAVPGDRYSAACSLCHGKKFSIKSLGISAVISHSAGKKHKNGKYIQFSVCYLDSRCNNTHKQVPFCKRFLSIELTTDSVVEVNKSPFLYIYSKNMLAK